MNQVRWNAFCQTILVLLLGISCNPITSTKVHTVEVLGVFLPNGVQETGSSKSLLIVYRGGEGGKVFRDAPLEVSTTIQGQTYSTRSLLAGPSKDIQLISVSLATLPQALLSHSTAVNVNGAEWYPEYYQKGESVTALVFEPLSSPSDEDSDA